MFSASYVYENPCSLSNPNVQTCIRNALNKAQEYLSVGIPEVGLPPLDPLEVKEYTIDQSLNELITIKANVKNVRSTGLQNSVIEEFK